MSRHTRYIEGHEVVVGWDPPLGTFFGQVYDPRKKDQDDELMEWVGLPPERIEYVGQLRTRLGHPWCQAIDRALAETLEAESHDGGARDCLSES